MKKKGQITIFIIVAIVIIVFIALFFIFQNKIIKPNNFGSSEKINPENFLKICIENKVEETIQTLSYQGGYIKNSLNTGFQFENEPYWNISYLCYTSANSLPCVIQQPSIINYMEKEITEEIKGDLESCFDDLILNYKEENYDVINNYNNFNSDLIEDKLIINLDAELTLTKSGESIRKKDFKIEFPTKLYNLGEITQKIIEKEAKFNYFDYIDYMFFNPDYIINLKSMDDQTKIYTLENIKTKEKFRFATRGAVLSS